MRFRVLVAAALVLLMTTPAMADLKTFARASGWEAFGGVNNDGKAVCGVSADVGDTWFSLKYFKGDSVLTVQLGDASWKGKVGQKVRLGMKFDDNPTWTATATAFKIKDEMALQFTVDAKAIDDWMEDFKQSYKLYIVFPDSDVDNWIADLTGTKVIGEQMEECVGWMSGK